MWNCPALHTSKTSGCFLCETYETRADYRRRWDYQAENKLGPWLPAGAKPPERELLPQPVEPGFFGKAINYVNDRAEWVAMGKPLVSDDVYQHRRVICDACPDRNVESDSCKWCGCPLHATALGDRLRWGVPQCPAKDHNSQPAPRWLAVLS